MERTTLIQIKRNGLAIAFLWRMKTSNVTAKTIPKSSSTNPLVTLQTFGQSVWLDFIRRRMFASGELQRFIDDDGVLGMTSNPSIFEKAIVGSTDYDSAIRSAASDKKSAQEIYQQLTVKDIQSAANLFRPTFERTQGRDGFVSLEVSPHLAHDSQATLVEARKLWKTVDRPNVLIKVPGTTEGLVAIRQLIREGINVNVTLLFGLDRYAEVIESYLSGLKMRLRDGNSIDSVTSVASFFLSRIDVAVDRLLPETSDLRGQTAINCAKVAYRIYQIAFQSKRFETLSKHGAKPQRLLWASTSTKNPVESDIKYIEALIGPDTVNTVPLKTLNAYLDHGVPKNRLEAGTEHASEALASLKGLNIDLEKVTEQLENEGVHKFSSAFDKLMTGLELKRQELVSNKVEIEPVTLSNFGDHVEKRIEILNSIDFRQRLWRKDASLWTSDQSNQEQIKNSLGWLHIAETMENSLDEIQDFAAQIQKAGFKHVVHMGMGGSSLAALVFSRVFNTQEDTKNGIPLTVLDTTDPETIRHIERSCPPEKTLFIVASKSGTTAEPLAFLDHFYAKVKLLKGVNAGENFIAITDPGTPLVIKAKELGFRRTFLNASDIGGRYSALSYFGLVPAALAGIDIREILNRAMMPRGFPALTLGAALGEMALAHRNKVTLFVDRPLSAFGLWLEQLIAESTGKEGKGLIPIADEPMGAPSSYGTDRFFIYLKMNGESETSPGVALSKNIDALRDAGFPILTLNIRDRLDLGREFFEWEFATAVAGSILEINAFDQPNVQQSKATTDKILDRGPELTPSQIPSLVEGVLSFYSTVHASSTSELLVHLLKETEPGNYIALMAFIPESPNTHKMLQALRVEVRNKLKLATTLGYGPRFLHSTGQLHKGGPNTGLFIQLTADPDSDLSIPGKSYTFGKFNAAQAQGDLDVLKSLGRRVLRVHLGGNIEAGLREFTTHLNSALGETYRSLISKH